MDELGTTGRRRPDVLIVAPCGFDLERTAREMHWMTARPGWRDLAAVRAGRVYLADGNQIFQPPGSARGGDAGSAGGDAPSGVFANPAFAGTRGAL